MTQSDEDVAAAVLQWLWEVLWVAIPTALIYSLIFFVIAVVVVVICQKFKVYTRSIRSWNILTKFHYPVLVLTFMGLGFGLGLISSFQKAGYQVLDEQVHPSLTGMVPPVKEKILESLPPELADKPMTGEEIYNHVIERLSANARAEPAEDEKKSGVIAEISREVEAEVRAYLVKALIDRAIVKAGEKMGVSEENAKFSVETFKSIDFSKQADEIADSITKTAKVHVAGFANGLRMQLFVYTFILIALMAIDPLIYYLGWLPQQRKKAEREAETPAAVI